MSWHRPAPKQAPCRKRTCLGLSRLGHLPELKRVARENEQCSEVFGDPCYFSVATLSIEILKEHVAGFVDSTSNLTRASRKVVAS